MSTHSHFTRWRRGAQLTVVAFYVLLPLVHLLDLRAVAGTLASLKIGPFDLTEPASGVAAAAAARTLPIDLLIGMAPLVVLAFVLGPVFCSWVCPWGLVSETVDRVKRKVSRRHEPTHVAGRKRRTAILAAILAGGALIGVPLAAILSAPRAITTLPLEVIYLRLISPVTGGFLLLLLAFEIAAPRRFFCRVVCPSGALLNLLRWPSTLRLHWTEKSCSCPRIALCHSTCSWGVDPRTTATFNGCTNCMECVDVCPSGSLRPRFGR